ncbi:hypothetical protein HBN50_13760 [Halobacteriovorax sp. GB3]|uniref:hypothetical protein n=1 Tax=Halobacteriovorax sp. GB3 TaxID=2719615 RepID=UPI002361B2B3|nr:hypothetical protein [Halobacteriovorax sp. GB3]MDD0854174.1 hypothetical protein [Halobacteriovorax sp. GB3]
MRLSFLMILAFLISVKVSAAPKSDKISINNLSMSYERGIGEGSFSAFNFYDYQYNRPMVFETQYNGTEVIFNLEDEQVVINDENGLLSILASTKIKGLNLENTSSEIKGNLSTFRAVSETKDVFLNNVGAHCKLITKPTNLRDVDYYLTNCLTDATINISKIDLSTQEKSLFRDVLIEALELEKSSDTSISELSLSINKHNYTLTLKVKASITAKVKVYGKVEYLEGSNKIHLTITKAKASFFNITNKVFEALKSKESEKLKVQRPHVYYSLE